MDIVAGSGNDEFYTPKYAIIPLLKYIPKHSIIWCPFDTNESNFVKLLKQHGCRVICSHLSEGHNFFDYNLKSNVDYDTSLSEVNYIISNPPYSLKGEVFNRLFELNLPFAMLVGVVGLFESKKRFEMFRDNIFEIMYFDKRIAYFKSFSEEKPSLNPPFSSVYLCRGILPNQIVFESINKSEVNVAEETKTEVLRHSSQD